MSASYHGIDDSLIGQEAAGLAVLQSLTAKLARTASVGEVCSLVLTEGASRFGGSTGSLCLVEANQLSLAATSGYSEEIVDAYRRFPLDEHSPAGLAVLTGRPVYCGSTDELLVRFSAVRDRPLVGNEAVAVLPLEANDTSALGALVIGFPTPHRFEHADCELLEALAKEAAAALERAFANQALHEARAAAEAAKDQLAFLAEASSRLAASLNLAQTLRTMAALASPRIADRCALYLVSPTLDIEKYALTPPVNLAEVELFEHVDVSIDDPSGPGAVIASGDAFFAPDFDESALGAPVSTPEQLDLVDRVGVGGTFIVPMQARGKRVGALGFLNRRGRRFSEQERALAEELAARSAVAIDNARLYEQELQIAATLQHALLPDRLPELPGLELSARYLPGTRGLDVGGDWYDVVPIEDRRALLVVGDVSGHGLQAATLMAALRHTIRAFATEGHTPSSILRKLARVLNVARDGHFATVLCGILDTFRNELVLSSAGHFGPLLLGEGEARFLEVEVGPPVGAVEDWRYPSTRVALPPTATLVAFTDGLVERRCEPLDVGLERLRSSAIANRRLRLDKLLARLVHDLVPDRAEDDTALLGLRLGDGA